MADPQEVVLVEDEETVWDDTLKVELVAGEVPGTLESINPINRRYRVRVRGEVWEQVGETAANFRGQVRWIYRREGAGE